MITFSEGADVTIQNSHHGVATFTNTKSGEDKADVKINGGKLNISNTTSSGRSAGIYSATIVLKSVAVMWKLLIILLQWICQMALLILAAMQK